MTYGFKMAADVTEVRAMGMLKEIEDDINRILKVCTCHLDIDI